MSNVKGLALPAELKVHLHMSELDVRLRRVKRPRESIGGPMFGQPKSGKRMSLRHGTLSGKYHKRGTALEVCT